MNRKGQMQLLLNPKTIIFTLGGGFLGFILFHTIEYTLVGGILGFVASIFIK